MIRALVFDFDGLILDTETAIVEAWAQVHERAGVAYTRAHALSVVGHVDVAHDLWAAFGTDVDRSALEAEHRSLHQAMLLKQTTLPGVAEILAQARDRGLRLGVASNSPHSWVDRHLDRLGLLPYFQTVRCREDVARGKPEPDVYLAAVAALGVTPEEAVAFEDSPPGSEAAKRAGLRCVVVPNPSTQHHTFPHADLRLASLAETSLAPLLARWKTPRSPRAPTRLFSPRGY